MARTMSSSAPKWPRVPRMDGSMDRFLDQRDLASRPRAKSYGPAETLGVATAPAFGHAPRFTFGGGVSRMSDFEPRRAELARMASSGRIMVPANKEAPPARRPRPARGFGSAPRLALRGGAFELPISPGPAAYDVPRNLEPAPDWAHASLMQWGVRTAQRSQVINYTATDAGPGERMAEHLFDLASTPCALFGERLKEHAQDYVPEPGTYPLPTSVGVGPAFSVGPGPRANLEAGVGARSPGHVYDPYTQQAPRQPPRDTFGSSIRLHVADVVNPDYPPGPGSHQVRKDASAKDTPSAAWPKDQKLKKVSGMGPVGYPSPGDYWPSPPKTRASAIHLPLTPYFEDKPGPGEYSPDIRFSKEVAPAWAPMSGRTDPRRSPFEKRNGNEEFSAALLRRAAEAATEMAQTQGTVQLDRLAFVPAGPKWSMTVRRATKELGPQTL